MYLLFFFVNARLWCVLEPRTANSFDYGLDVK